MRFTTAILSALFVAVTASPLSKSDTDVASLEKRQSSVAGIDVDFQTASSLAWASLYASRRFVYIQTTYGDVISNAAWSSQNSGALSAGFIAGRVHHPRPAVSSPAVQARFFTNNAGGKWIADGKNLRGALYLEKNIHETSMPYCYGLTPSAWVAWIQEFATTYRSLNSNRWPVIHTSYTWWTQCAGGYSGFGAMDLWLYTTNGATTPIPPGWTSFKVLKISVTPGSAPDQDHFFGSLADLSAWAL